MAFPSDSERPPSPATSPLGVWRPAALLCAVVLIAHVRLAQGSINIWTSHGPPAGSVAALAMDPTTPTTPYAVAARDVSAADGGAATSANRIDVCGAINADTTWSAANVWVITCDIAVEAGATLTIEPGTVVKLTSNRDLEIRAGGALMVNGTAEAPVVVTSLADNAYGGDTNSDGTATTPAPGDWASIYFYPGSRGRLTNAVLRYGGGYYTRGGLVQARSSDIVLNGVTLERSADAGLYAELASPTITRSLVRDNAGVGLRFWAPDASAPLVVTGNHFAANLGMAGEIEFIGQPHGPVSVEGNQAEATYGGFRLYGETRGEVAWDNGADLPLVAVYHDLSIASDARLTLGAGTLVKLDRNRDLAVRGTLTAEGEDTAPVVFTSVTDDAAGGDTNADGAATAPAPGDWASIYFYPGSRGRLTRAELRYGGGYYARSGLVQTHSNDVVLDGVILEHSADAGLLAENGSALVRGSVAGNPLGIRNETPSKGVVDARRVWWGDASGPLHRTKNPQGTGNEVSDGALFFPWAVDEDGTVPTQVAVRGPARVSPGDTADFVVAYHAGQLVENAVLVLSPPGDASYLESTGGGIYLANTHEVLWKLGSLEPGAEGEVSVRLRFLWGLQDGVSEVAAAALGGTNLEDWPVWAEGYLQYTPLAVVLERELADAEIEQAIEAAPDMAYFVDEAESDEFRLVLGLSTTFNDGGQRTLLVMMRPDAVVVIEQIGDIVFEQRQRGAVHEVRTREGGVRWDAALATRALLGMPTAAARAAFAQVPPPLPFPACFGNCLLQRLSTGYYPPELMNIVRSNPCVNFYNGLPTRKQCEQALRSAGVRTGSRDHYGSAGNLAIAIRRCKGDCTDTSHGGFFRDRWRCSEGHTASLCGRRDSGGLNVFHSRLQRAYFQKFVCVDGIFQNAGFGYCPSGGSLLNPTYGHCFTHPPLFPGTLVPAWPQSECWGADCQPVEPVPRAIERSDCRLTPATTTVRVAKDPNAKHGPAGDVVPGQLLDYAVEYENVGEGRAFGVYITDELSPHLDEATLDLHGAGQFLAATRTILWEIGELAPKGEEGSKGERTFTIRVKSGLSSGTVITNKAIVYFPSVPEETPTNTVVNVVQPLAAVPQSLETPYGTPIAITLTGRDVSGTPLTYAIEERPLSGELTGTLPHLTYTHTENFTGQDRFTFTVSNGVSTSRTADVTILVTPSAADTIAPEVTWTYPESGAVIEGVPADPVASDDTGPLYAPSVLAGFSEAMDPATITGTTVRVVTGVGREVEALVAWDGTTNQAVLVPREAWQNGSYTARVTTGVADASGNPLAAEYSWSFRIGASACTGDCNDNGAVTIDELLTMVNIALGNADVMTCAAGDANHDEQVTIDEILAAVNNALNGCP